MIWEVVFYLFSSLPGDFVYVSAYPDASLVVVSAIVKKNVNKS